MVLLCVVWLTNRQTRAINSPIRASQSSTQLSPSSRVQGVSQMPGGPYEAADPRWAEVHRLDETDKGWEWKMPISFYGKVVDERMQPIEGASIHFQWTDTSSKGTSEIEQRSDPRGLFSLQNVRGKFLEVRVSKKGYYISSQNSTGFEYAAFWDRNYYEPNPDDPVVFRLRKESAFREPLIVRQTLYGIKADGTPHYIDLKTGKKVVDQPRGDVEIDFVRGEDNQMHRYDWSIIIKGVNGAELVESTDEFMFQAPEAGYQTSLEFGQPGNDPHWEAQMQKKLFVRRRDGTLYARLEVDIMPRYNRDAAVNIQAYINPHGSRNLEYDPAKRINSY